MTVALEINGTSFTGWQEVEIKRCLDFLAGTFQLKISGDVQNEFPVTRGSAVRVTVNGQPVLTGFVDRIRVGYAATDHTLTIEGRDKTCDLVDSTVDGKFSFNSPATLVSITKAMLAYYGITGMGIIDKTGGIDPFEAEDVVTMHLGVSVFEALESYCRLRQVFMTTDGNGNIVYFQAGQAADSGTKLTHIVSGPGAGPSNILHSDITFDDSDRFNRYVVWSQGNPQQLESVTEDEDDPGVGSEDIATRDATATDSGIRPSRVLNFTAEHSVGGKVGNTKGKRKRLKKGANEDIDDRATWEANIRRARALDYVVTVQGHTKPGTNNPWQVFETVPVQDDFADVSAVLLIKQVVLKLSLGTGTTTELSLVNQDAYTLKAEEDQRTAEANKVGGKFSGASVDLNH